MNITKYKLLKEMPDIKAGKIGKVIHRNELFKDTVEFESDYGLEPTYFNIDFVEQKPDWFAPMLFTTEDGVDIYTGDYYFTVFSQSFTDAYGDFIEANKVYGENIAHCDTTGFVDYVKLFSTKQAAEKYLEPKFKVGDFITNAHGKVMKLDKIYLSDDDWVAESPDCNEKIYLEFSKKSTNEEIIKYYRDLGWIEGAKFRSGGDYDAVNRLIFKNNVLGVLFETTREWKELYACELIKYPKIFEDLKEVHGYAIGENYIFRDFEYCNNYASHKIFKTQKQAKSAIAFAQLSQLLAEMNGDWQPDWNDLDRYKFVIVRSENRKGSYLTKQEYTTTFHPLAFKSAEARDFSFHHHENLWKQFWQI